MKTIRKLIALIKQPKKPVAYNPSNYRAGVYTVRYTH